MKKNKRRTDSHTETRYVVYRRVGIARIYHMLAVPAIRAKNSVVCVFSSSRRWKQREKAREHAVRRIESGRSVDWVPPRPAKTNHHSSWLASRPLDSSRHSDSIRQAAPPRAVIRRRLCPVISLNAVPGSANAAAGPGAGPRPIYFNQSSNSLHAERDAESFSLQSADGGRPKVARITQQP